MSVHLIKSSRDGAVTALTFEISNHTAAYFVFGTARLQNRNGPGWETLRTIEPNLMTVRAGVRPHGTTTFSCDVTNAPLGAPMRFGLQIQQQMKGFKGLLRRWQLRHFVGVPRGFSLNPYDNMSSVYGPPSWISTEEFVEPDEQLLSPSVQQQ